MPPTGRVTDATAAVLRAPIYGVNITLEVADFDRDKRRDIFVGQIDITGARAARDRLLLNRTR